VLTPSTLRLDLKCGKGSISPGEKCTKGAAQRTAPKKRLSRKTVALGLTAGAVGTALLFKGSRQAILRSPRAAQRLTQKGITEVVHRATAKPPSMRLTPRSFERMRPPSKTTRLHNEARAANRAAEKAIAKAARTEVERIGVVGEAMFKSGKAARASLRSGSRRHRLTVEKLRRRYEPGYRKNVADGLIQHSTAYIDPSLNRSDKCWNGYKQAGMKRKGKRRVPNCIPISKKDSSDTKKYSKTVTNPETGRKNKVRFGAKGYKIAPGTDKGDRYCARSFGDMKSHSKNCAGPDRNTPLCLSRAKWKCSGKASRRDGDSTTYYRTHPEAAAKKVRHQATINARPEERKRRASLNRERRRRGIAGKGGPDISHTVGGKTVLEDPSTNRARNGHGKNPRLKGAS